MSAISDCSDCGADADHIVYVVGRWLCNDCAPRRWVRGCQCPYCRKLRQ